MLLHKPRSMQDAGMTCCWIAIEAHVHTVRENVILAPIAVPLFVVETHSAWSARVSQ